jgi:tetratricopeptide (TPR) repeat protein
LPVRPTTYAYAEAVARYGRALGAARLGTPDGQARARAEIEQMNRLRATYLERPDQAYWAEQIQILVESATGWLARAGGSDAEAIRHLRAGADLEDASEKHVAMENRILPVREQLGDLLLELGQADAALAEYQVSLKATPNRLRGYYGAARAAEGAGLTGMAREYRDKLQALTSQATGTRPEIEYARRSIAAR